MNRTTALAIVATAAAGAFIGVVLALAILSDHSGQQEQTIWCKAIQPGAQYESNSVRYATVIIGPGTGLSTPTQGCASMDDWQTYVPSSAP